MKLITPTELARRCKDPDDGVPLTKQAVFKAMDAGIIPFVQQGKKKLIDLDDPAIKLYISDSNRQRNAVKKNDGLKGKNTSKVPEKKPKKTAKKSKKREKKSKKAGKRSKKPDKKSDKKETLSDLLKLDPREIRRRSEVADMQKRELQVETLQKKFLPRIFIEDALFRYLERLNSNLERASAVFVNEIGQKILEAEEVLPEHIEKFVSGILGTIHKTKAQIIKEIETYEPKL